MNRTLKPTLIGVLIILAAAGVPVRGADPDAVAISNTIQQRHMPNGTIIDPIFASPSSHEIVAYTRGGDSATWTGHYLAAEAFRYKVTASPDALANIWKVLHGIRSLRVVTGTDLLARCLVPVDWPFASSITHEEAGHGIGSTKTQTDALAADWIAFVKWRAGLPEWRPDFTKKSG